MLIKIMEQSLTFNAKPPHLRDVLETSNCDGEVHAKQGKVSKSYKGWLRLYIIRIYRKTGLTSKPPVKRLPHYNFIK